MHLFFSKGMPFVVTRLHGIPASHGPVVVETVLREVAIFPPAAFLFWCHAAIVLHPTIKQGDEVREKILPPKMHPISPPLTAFIA